MRMARRNLTNGAIRINTSVTGKTIKNKGLEYNTIQKEISMREAGIRTKGMGKEHTG